jgi:hypothetical protein
MGMGLSVLVSWCPLLMAANRNFVFRIKTKGGGIIRNIVIEVKEMEAAKPTPRALRGLRNPVGEGKMTQQQT